MIWVCATRELAGWNGMGWSWHGTRHGSAFLVPNLGFSQETTMAGGMHRLFVGCLFSLSLLPLVLTALGETPRALFIGQAGEDYHVYDKMLVAFFSLSNLAFYDLVFTRRRDGNGHVYHYDFCFRTCLLLLLTVGNKDDSIFETRVPLARLHPGLGR
jgi:hypothetical protein